MKDKIKNKNRKRVVEDYQEMVQRSIDKVEGSEEKLSPKMKWYVKGLKDSIKEAPYLLGYLKRPNNKEIIKPNKKKHK